MRKISLLFLYIIFALNLGAQDFKNLGFEEIDPKSKTRAKAWYTTSANYKVEIDHTISYHGTNSMLIEGLNQEKSGAFMQTTFLNSPKNQKHIIKGLIKRDDLSADRVRFSVNVLGLGKSVFFATTSDFTPSDKSGWDKFEMEFVVDEKSSMINIAGVLVGSGQVWFDEIEIETIGGDSYEEFISLEAKNYLDNALGIINTHSLRKDSMDFEKLEKIAFQLANGANTSKDCYVIVKYLLNQLGDNHSFFKTPREFKNWKTRKDDKPEVILPMAQGYLRDDNIAYINVPHCASGDSLAIMLYADSLQDLIERFDKQNPKGWIVDLRQNTGGNCYPMLAGLGPLYDSEVLGYFEDVNGKFSNWGYRKKGSFERDTLRTVVGRQPYKISEQRPLAVLIGPKTASSGELTALSFIGQNDSRLFGEPSYGVSTSNEGYLLSDSSQIILTTAYMMDRNKKRYGGKIQPDVFVKFSSIKYNEEDDPVVKAATNWLHSIGLK